jgi:ketosteroid isomerase-like protein
MNGDENKRLIESFFEAGNQGDLDRCLELLDDRVTWTNIGSTKFSGTCEGKEVLGNSYCHVFRIDDGKIIEVTEYMDTELASSVLGR